jgi:hypothetical protein
VDFDFEKGFFEQFDILVKRVPFLSTVVIDSTNSEFSVYSHGSKNVYLSSRVGHSSDVYYSYHVLDHSENIFDCCSLFQSQDSYECVECEKISHCTYSQRCKNSSYLEYCFDCSDCHDCCFCMNLKNKSFCFENKQYSETEYRNILVKFHGLGLDKKDARFCFNKLQI